jgi:hypothetical protein
VRKLFYHVVVLALVLFHAGAALAPEKLLTIDDIFDPAKRVNFGGTPSTPRWLKDGVHYIVASKDRNASPRLLKVNAITGKSEPFYDSVKMEAAFSTLPGFTKDVAHRLANETSYQMNPAETGVLINHANDLFYYEFGSDRAVRLTSTPEEEVGEAFSPDGRMVSFIRDNNLYVEDIDARRQSKALEWPSGLGLSGRALRPRQLWRLLVESRFHAHRFPSARRTSSAHFRRRRSHSLRSKCRRHAVSKSRRSQSNR